MFEKIIKTKNCKRKLFKQHFLKGVILQLQFDNNIENYVNNDKNFELFLEAENYSKKENLYEKKFILSVETEKVQPAVTTGETTVVGHNWCDSRSNNRIQIIKDKLSFIQSDYKNYTELDKLVKSFLNLIKKDYTVKKIGFRKTNSIIAREIESLEDITSLFTDNIFASLRFGLFDLDNLKNYRDSLSLAKNQSTVTINTSCIKIKSLEKAYEIIFDTDLAYNDVLTNKDINKVINAMNKEHFNIFCWMTSDKMKKILNMEEF